MRTPTTRQAAAQTPTARAAWCMVGTAALGFMLAACGDLGARGADTLSDENSIGREHVLATDLASNAVTLERPLTRESLDDWKATAGNVSLFANAAFGSIRWSKRMDKL